MSQNKVVPSNPDNFDVEDSSSLWLAGAWRRLRPMVPARRECSMTPPVCRFQIDSSFLNSFSSESKSFRRANQWQKSTSHPACSPEGMGVSLTIGRNDEPLGCGPGFWDTMTTMVTLTKVQHPSDRGTAASRAGSSLPSRCRSKTKRLPVCLSFGRSLSSLLF